MMKCHLTSVVRYFVFFFVVMLMLSSFCHTLAEVSPKPTMSPKQKNAINMLNYMRALAQEIRTSSDNKVYLDKVHSSLFNNTEPSAVDAETLDVILNMVNTLEEYKMIAVKKEQLKYFHDQNQAQSIRNAIPNPIGLLSAVSSFDWAGFASSIVYMTIDSFSSYQSSISSADMSFLQDNLELDAKATKAVNDSREYLFVYMVNLVNNNNLDGKLVLSEDDIDEFIQWRQKGPDDLVRKITYYKNHESKFKAFGPYWITLAECYYENKQYADCLRAITEYEKLGITIFKQDHDYARVLPLAINSAREVLKGKEYIDACSRYSENILDNAEKDWDLRYFVAQTYVELYSITQNKDYLQQAYDIVLNNVNILIDTQKINNNEYTEDIDKITPEGVTKKVKDQYKKLCKEKRKKQLPPVSESLILNCDLLFSLAEELHISEEEKDHITSILKNKDSRLFYVTPIDNLYRFSSLSGANDNELEKKIEFKGDTIILPVAFVTDRASIIVKIIGAVEEEYTDWTISKVDRKVQDDPMSYLATFESKAIRKHTFHGDEQIVVMVDPYDISDAVSPLSFTFEPEWDKRLGVLDSWEWLDNATKWTDKLRFVRRK